MKTCLLFFIGIATTTCFGSVDLARIYLSGGGGLNLTWVTQSEAHNAGFLIDVRVNNMIGNNIWIPGAGNSDTPQRYFASVFLMPMPGDIYTYALSSQDSTGVIEMHAGSFPAGPIPAETDSFNADADENGVIITAVTAWERPTLVTQCRITRQPINSFIDTSIVWFEFQGDSLNGSTYQYTDTTASPGQAYRYNFMSAIYYWNEWGIPSSIGVLLATDTVSIPPLNTDRFCNMNPTVFDLSSFPNPFNSSTTISYVLRQSGEVKLEVFDIVGRRVEVLTDELMQAGEHHATFNGQELPSGMYFCILQSPEQSQVQKILLLK